jgi:hypothetical protein
VTFKVNETEPDALDNDETDNETYELDHPKILKKIDASPLIENF